MSATRWASWSHGVFGRPGAGFVDRAGSLAAIVVLIVAAMTAVMQESADTLEPAREAAEARPGPQALAAPPTKEFMVGAYAGAPYTYASDVTIKNGGTQDFTA